MRDSRDKDRRVALRALARLDKARRYGEQRDMEQFPDRAKTRQQIIRESHNNPGSFDYDPRPAY